MATEIIIVGGLLDAPDRESLLARLRSVVSDEVVWDWISCSPGDHFEAPRGPMNRLREKLTLWRKDSQRNPAIVSSQTLRVIKLYDLHGRTQSMLYQCCPDPILPPPDVRNSEDFIEWVRSPESGLFPSREWCAGLTEAALVAILCKLLRNKSWNAGVQGHAWTKEEDLLTQSPVARDDRPKVAAESRRLLPTLDGKLLLSKGAGQGRTPKEWSIDTRFLPAVKRAITSNSVLPLAKFDSLKALVARITQDSDKAYRLDIEIVTDKVLSVCRQRD